MHFVDTRDYPETGDFKFEEISMFHLAVILRRYKIVSSMLALGVDLTVTSKRGIGLAQMMKGDERIKPRVNSNMLRFNNNRCIM